MNLNLTAQLSISNILPYALGSISKRHYDETKKVLKFDENTNSKVKGLIDWDKGRFSHSFGLHSIY